MTRPSSMNDSPVKIIRPDSSSSSCETPEKELHDLALGFSGMDGIPFSSIGNDTSRHNFSLTPGPNNIKTRASKPETHSQIPRLTPGANEKVVLSSQVPVASASTESENCQHLPHHTGAFEHAFFNSPVLKESQVSQGGMRYSANGSPLGPGPGPLQPIDRNSPRLQSMDPNTFSNVMDSTPVYDEDIYDFSPSVTVNTISSRNQHHQHQHHPLPEGFQSPRREGDLPNRKSKVLHLMHTNKDDEDATTSHHAPVREIVHRGEEEEQSPTQFLLTRNLQDLLASPLTVDVGVEEEDVESDHVAPAQTHMQRQNNNHSHRHSHSHRYHPRDIADIGAGVQQQLFPQTLSDTPDDQELPPPPPLTSSSTGGTDRSGDSCRGERTRSLSPAGEDEEHHHFDISPGKNIHSAIFKPRDPVDRVQQQHHKQQSRSESEYANNSSSYHHHTSPESSHRDSQGQGRQSESTLMTAENLNLFHYSTAGGGAFPPHHHHQQIHHQQTHHQQHHHQQNHHQQNHQHQQQQFQRAPYRGPSGPGASGGYFNTNTPHHGHPPQQHQQHPRPLMPPHPSAEFFPSDHQPLHPSHHPQSQGQGQGHGIYPPRAQEHSVGPTTHHEEALTFQHTYYQSQDQGHGHGQLPSSQFQYSGVGQSQSPSVRSSISSIGSDNTSVESGGGPGLTRSLSPPLPHQMSSGVSQQHHKQQQQQHRSMTNNNNNRLYLSVGSMSSAPNSGNLISMTNLTNNHLRNTFPPPSSHFLHNSGRGFDASSGFTIPTNTSLDLSTVSNSKYFTALPLHPNNNHTGMAYTNNTTSAGVASGVASGHRRYNKEDPTKATRQEQVESPNSKASYKFFFKQFAQKEAISVEEALRFAQEEAVKISPKIKWRVYLDAADLLRRNNRFEDARYMYALACEEFPQVQQGWMELSKLEEECGHFEKSLKILRRGTKLSLIYNEVLLMKAIKQHEKLSHLMGARDLLGKLYNEPIEKIWRTVLEGALLEERAGNVVVARKLLSVLVHKVAWYGPIYYEAFRLEEKAELFDGAYLVIKMGLTELPRYGPLWFGLLRVTERADITAELETWQRGDGTPPRLVQVREECQSAICSISRELVWKVHFEQAQIEERAAIVVARSQSLATHTSVEQCLHPLLDKARQCFVLSMLACPSNLRWKIFLAGARMELNAGQVDTVQKLLRQAHMEVPEKSRFHVFLECARLEEYAGSVDAARRILTIARSSIKNEWKIYLESVLVEARAGNLTTAIFIADQALLLDSGSGRLWALLLQLVHRVEWKQKMLKKLHSTGNKNPSVKQTGMDINKTMRDTAANVYIQAPANYQIPSKFSVLSRALQVVPKSGEVWCEGARVLLNPFSPSTFHPFRAMQFLAFAIMFTPQYGDSFVEYTRLEMLLQVLLPQTLTLLGIPVQAFCRLLEQQQLQDASASDGESDFVGRLREGAVSVSKGCERPFLFVSEDYHQAHFPTDRVKRRANMQLAVNNHLALSTSTSDYDRVALKRLYRR